MPEMEPVDSRSIAAMGYDHDSRELFVQFVSGDLYVYFDVPSPVHDAFMTAPSKGAHLNREIKPVYRFKKLASGRQTA